MTSDAFSTAGWLLLLGCAVAVGSVMTIREGRRVLRRIDVDVAVMTRAAVNAHTTKDPARPCPATCEVGTCTLRATTCYDSHPSGQVLWICDSHAVGTRRQVNPTNLELGPLP